ncbi:leucine--tRNA ligase [Candidatus Woesearchaeota archaeon]|nr:leucine--tRNA ligase [Candidatus Woesearchaeota archaeon]
MHSFKPIQDKWQKKWAEQEVFKVVEDNKKPKFYCLEMFPYPSGSGLHMGHAFNYTIGDVYSRFKRMNGFNVLYPMGYDSLGLPAENAAIQAKAHPKKFTEDSIKTFIKQQKELGLSYDWSRTLSSHEPEYYKWNQYFFLKFLENDLVYKKKAAVNWCSKCNTVLANEQVHGGKCWRHTDTEVKLKHLEQWFIKTTQYAEELLEDLDKINWPQRIKIMQRNWVGKSHGTTITFKINDVEWPIFTTRPDTLFGVTFMVISAQHPKLDSLVTKEQKSEVDKFLKKITSTSAKDTEELDKVGAFTGSYAINPINNEKVPVYTGNFVLAEYGSGLVMAVPAHDQRDFEFAKKYKLPIRVVIEPFNHPLDANKMSRAYVEDGRLVNSGDFNDANNRDAIEEISVYLEKSRSGKRTVQYKLRDWLISRQRYWGTPIPIIYCDACGMVPVPYDQLPVKLPEKVKFGKGNPLLTSKDFVNVKCPKCNKDAKRETDTMDTFMDSSWYFLRYCDNKNDKEPFKKSNVKYWMPVDQYIGGAEHACMHLIYARFFTKALRDLKMLDFDEPFTNLFNQGMLHGEDGHVMSKSRGNTVLPEVVSKKYGIDTARFFLVSIALPDKDLEWSSTGIDGTLRFIIRVMKYFDNVKIGKDSKKVESKLNSAIKNITEYIENFKYNLAIINIRKLFESLDQEVSKATLEKFLKLLHPFCPHITEELWEKIGNKPFISLENWPKFDASKIDLEVEAAQDLVDQTRKDILHIKSLLSLKGFKKVKVIVAQEYKYQMFKIVKKQLEKTRDPTIILKELMNTDLKEYGKEISKSLGRLISDPSKLPSIILGDTAEIKALNNAKTILEKEFNTSIEIIKEVDSKESKSGNAMPGKPAIIIE